MSGGFEFCPHPAHEHGFLYNTSPSVLVVASLEFIRNTSLEKRFFRLSIFVMAGGEGGTGIYFIRINTHTELWRERKFFMWPLQT